MAQELGGSLWHKLRQKFPLGGCLSLFLAKTSGSPRRNTLLLKMSGCRKRCKREILKFAQYLLRLLTGSLHTGNDFFFLLLLFLPSRPGEREKEVEMERGKAPCCCRVFIVGVVRNIYRWWWVFAEMHVSGDACDAALLEWRPGFSGCIFHVSAIACVSVSGGSVFRVEGKKKKKMKMLDCVRGFSPLSCLLQFTGESQSCVWRCCRYLGILQVLRNSPVLWSL